MVDDAARRATSFLLGRLQGEIARLKAAPFPGHDVGPRKWLNFVSGIVATSQGYLALAVKAGTSAADANKLIRDAEALGGEAYEFLKFVAGAEATEIPHQVVAPFQRWAFDLSITNTIFFRSEHLPNYEITTIDYSDYNSLNHPDPTLLAAISAINWPVRQVTVPGQAMGMLPHFAVVAHELGHAIQDRIKPDLSKHSQAITDCVDRIKTRLTNSGASFGQVEIMRFNRIAQSWVNELKADAVGHFLVGPAFFFALFGFLEIAAQSYGIAPTHPPSDLRRDLLFAELSGGAKSFAGVFQKSTNVALTPAMNSPNVKSCPPSDQLSVLLSKNFSPTDSAILVELIPLMQTLGPTIFATVKQHFDTTCPKQIYTADQLELDLEAHLEQLCNLVPPIEHRKAGSVQVTNLASILNVGWAALLTRLDRIPEPPGENGDATARRMERLHELLLKAAELSEAKMLWDQHK